MKTIKELVESFHMDKAVPAAEPKGSTTKNPNVPSIIVLRRKATRSFPGNQKIVLYYSDTLDKYVTVPFGPNGDPQGISLAEEEQEQLNEFVPALAIAGHAARAALTSTAGRAAITGAANLAKRGAAMLGRGLKSTKRVWARKGKAARVVGRAGRKVVGTAAKIAAGGDDDGRGVFNKSDNLTYRATEYRVNPNTRDPSQPTTGPTFRRNWDEIEKAKTKRVWNTGTYTPTQVYEEIQNIAKSNEAKTINIGNSSIEITPRIANKICECHAMLNSKNQKNFEALLGESVTSFRKVIDFSIRKGK